MPFLNSEAVLISVAAAMGVFLDRLLGEPRNWHPLVGFGKLANHVEALLRQGAAPGHPVATRILGLLGWLLLVAPPVIICWQLLHVVPMPSELMLHAALLWFALGSRSLGEHAHAVSAPLAHGDLQAAREAVGRMVSRDTNSLDEHGVAKAGVESVLENGNDAIFGTLFWFALFGGAGALLFRLANTLDGMWGYRSARLLYFGWAAARIDDVLNYIPARLTALTYALLGHTQESLRCWRTQAAAWSSPNAGPVMAAGAGALGISLGGAAIYHGHLEQRPPLGSGPAPNAADINRAMRLVQRGMWLWLVILMLAELNFA